MMFKLEQAARQALGCLEEIHVGNMTPMAEENWKKAITALREALAEQAEQEPVARVIGGVFEPCNDDVLSGAWELYAAPVRVQDLTDDEIHNISSTITNAVTANMTVEDWKRSFARAVISADREKNK